MPVFQPRNRVQILREMIARVIARSDLIGVDRDSTNFHVLAASANEDAEQYVQMARLRALFSIDRATGSDLDERAKEILPGTIQRRQALAASGTVVFSRPGTTGTVAIAAGTIVAASDADGQIKFRTTAAGSILNGSTASAPINVVATTRGDRGNVPAGDINQFVSRIAGVTTVTNGSAFSNGVNRENDASFKARLKAFVQALSRATPNALKGFARNVILRDGRRVLFASLREPIIPDGTVDLFIDDGTGFIEEVDDTFITSLDTLVSPAVGGEKNLFTTNRPVKDDGSFALFVNAALQTRGVDYELNAPLGQVELSTASYPLGLAASDVVTANYRYFIGIIQETQRIIDGDPSDPIRVPGVRGSGIQVFVLAPQLVPQSITAQVSALPDFDPAEVISNVQSAIQDYINTLDIGADVIVSEIVERAMSVTGMFDFRIDDLTGSGAGGTNQVILENQVARITSGSITLT